MNSQRLAARHCVARSFFVSLLQGMFNMSTKLSDIIVDSKCRRGRSTNITRKGAYWLCGEPINTARAGGDGIGQSAMDITICLELRHYRSGETAAMVRWHAWHQNGAPDDIIVAADICECIDAETVVSKLKSMSINGERVLDGFHEDNFVAHLVSLGLRECEPSPDDE